MDLIEVLGPAGRAAYAAEQVEAWMADEPRAVDPALFGSGRAYVQPQPKGVIGKSVLAISSMGATGPSMRAAGYLRSTRV